MKKIYRKNKIYSEEEINNIATINKMITVDCLKDENMISIEKEGKIVCLNLEKQEKIKFFINVVRI